MLPWSRVDMAQDSELNAEQSQLDAKQSQLTRIGSSVESEETSRTRSNEWLHVKDASERRKIQNKLAQRRFRDKLKEQKLESEREAENQRQAGGSYAIPDPNNIDTSQDLSGLPWGGISIKHIVETGMTKQKNSRQTAQEKPMHGSASRIDGGGSSSRLGLRLSHQFAQAHPASKYLRCFSYQPLERGRR